MTGQGVLQGSSSTAPILLSNSDISLLAYKQLGAGASFSHPIHGMEVADFAVQFVAVTSQFLNMKSVQKSPQFSDDDNEPSLFSRFASNNSQIWSD